MHDMSVTRMKMMKIRKRMKIMNKSRNNYLKSLSLMQKGVWWMRSFSFLHNKRRDAKGRLGEQRMLSFQRIEVDTLSQCFQRLLLSISPSTLPIYFSFPFWS